MALYGFATRDIKAAGSAADGAITDIKAAATGRVSLLEIAVHLNLSVGLNIYFWGLGRATTELIQADGVSFISEENDLVSETKMATSWYVRPVVPVQFFRRHAMTPSGLSGVIWSFPRGLSIAPSASLILWQSGSTPTGCLVSAEIDE